MAQPGAAPPLATIKLNCFVFGDSESLFTVSVANTDRVNQLQEAVKEKKKHAFRDVDADALKLWKAGIVLLL
jgi:hypothetical protein